MNNEPQIHNEDCYDSGELRNNFPRSWWQNSTYTDHRGEAAERCPQPNRGCASAIALVICAIVIPLFILFVVAMTMAQACIQLQDWILTSK